MHVAFNLEVVAVHPVARVPVADVGPLSAVSGGCDLGSINTHTVLKTMVYNWGYNANKHTTLKYNMKYKRVVLHLFFTVVLK